MKLILITFLIQQTILKTLPIYDFMKINPLQFIQNVHRVYALHYHPSPI